MCDKRTIQTSGPDGIIVLGASCGADSEVPIVLLAELSLLMEEHGPELIIKAVKILLSDGPGEEDGHWAAGWDERSGGNGSTVLETVTKSKMLPQIEGKRE